MSDRTGQEAKMKAFVAVLLSCLLLQCYARPQSVALPQKCEDVLTAQQCQQLRDAASKLHEKASDVLDAIQEAAKNHVTNAKDVLDFVRERLVEKATNFECKDALSADTCDQLISLAKRLHVKVQEVNLAVKEAIVRGAVKAKELITLARARIAHVVTNAKCEDILDADTCQKIVDFAKKVHLKASDVIDAVKEAIAEGAKDPQAVLKKAIELMKAKLSCDNVLGKDKCDKLRSLAQQVGVSIAKLDEVMREAIAKGLTSARELYKAVIDYIMDKWGDLIGKRELLQKRDIGDKVDEIFDKIKKKLREAVLKATDKILDALDVVDGKLRQKVKDLIVKGKVKIDELKDKVLELLDKLGHKAGLTYAESEIIDAIKEKLRQALLKAVDKILDALNVAEGVVREKVKELITKGEVKIAELKEKVLEILANLGITVYDEELMDIGDTIDDIFDKIKEKLRKAILKATDKILDALDVVDVKLRQKVKDLIVKGKVKIDELKDKVLELLDKLGHKAGLTYADSEIIDAIKEKLRQALLKAVDQILDALNVAEGVVREKVKELITKGEVKLAELKEKLLEILANLGITVYDEELMDIGDTIDDIFDKIKEKLRKAVLKATDKILDALDVVDVKLRQKVKDLIVKGKVKIDELKDKVLELLDKLGHKAGLTYADSEIIDAIKEKLRQALLKAVDKILDALNVAEGVVREKVKELITKGEVKIAELKEKVLEILANLGITVYDEALMDTGATIDDIIEKIKEKLKQALLKAVDKIMDALNIADGKIREKVEDLIVKGKVKISELKEKVLEILKNLGVSTTADEALFLNYYEDVLLDEFVEDVIA